MSVEFYKVDSSNISKIGCLDKLDGLKSGEVALVIEFKKNYSQYAYYPMSREECDHYINEMQESPSVNDFFRKNIMNSYEYKKI